MSQEPLRRQTGSVRLGPGAGRHASREVPQRVPTRVGLPPVNTLPEVLRHHAHTRPSQPLFHFVDLEDKLTVLTAGDLLHNARRIGANLRARGVGVGDRVVLSFDTCPEFIEAFFACSLLGAIPCLIELPSTKVSVQSWGERLRTKLDLLGARAMLIDQEMVDLPQEALPDFHPEGLEGPFFVATVNELVGEAEPFEPPTPGADDVAFIQFTSGTTDSPKGVRITHRALFANCSALAERGRWDTDDLMVCWLPLYHDMGLVASVLSSFTHGIPVALMPNFGFLLKPSRWLWALHYFRGTNSFAPNFAYQLALKRIKDAEVEGLELGTWKRAYNAAEFIHQETVRQFTARFQPYGFDADAWHPAYGMAEVVVGAIFREPSEPVRTETISRSALASSRQAVTTIGEGSDALTVFSVGRPLRGVELRVVDESGQELGERHEGELLLRGTSLMAGYYRNPQATADALRDGWLHTGDLGYVADGQVFITGRCKDLIIKAGENYHPYTMENAASQVQGVRAGCVAALGVNNLQTGTEDIVLVVETAETDLNVLRQLCKYVEEVVYQSVGVRPNRVLPVPPKTVPKTTSGKIRRASIRQDFEAFESISLLVPPDKRAVVH